MSVQPGAVVYTQGFGSRPENLEVPHIDTRAPTSYDIIYPVGKKWVDTAGNATYTLTSLSTQGGVGQATWTVEGGSAAAGVTSVATQSGTATPASGVLTINGDAGVNILTSASGSTVVVALDANPEATSFTGTYLNTLISSANALTLNSNVIEGAGTGTNVDIVLTPKGTGQTALSQGNLNLQGASSKVLINAATTASASVGSATLVAGTVTVSTTAVTASSLIFLTVGALGTVSTAQAVCVSAQTAGTSFVITSADNTDTSVVNWWIIN
jgi:hypothetical protein